MGQFPEDGNFGGFMSNFFFKQKATGLFTELCHLGPFLGPFLKEIYRK